MVPTVAQFVKEFTVQSEIKRLATQTDKWPPQGYSVATVKWKDVAGKDQVSYYAWALNHDWFGPRRVTYEEAFADLPKDV